MPAGGSWGYECRAGKQSPPVLAHMVLRCTPVVLPAIAGSLAADALRAVPALCALCGMCIRATDLETSGQGRTGALSVCSIG
jgi:hypothetical protein